MEWASAALHQDMRHYAIVPDLHSDAIYAGLSETMNVEFVRYADGEHGKVVEILQDISDRVAELRAIGFGV